MKNLLVKLDTGLEEPSSCVITGGKRECGLIERQNLLSGDSKFYIRNRLFTTTYYTRVPVRISKITRNNGFVSFTKTQSHWEKRTSRAHPKVRKIVYINARKAFITLPHVNAAIHDFAEKNSKSKSPLTQNAIVLELMTSRFKKEYFGLVKKELLKSQIITMRKQFKDVVLRKEPEHAIVTDEIVSLPRSLSRLGNKKLSQILTYKIQFD